MAANCNIIECKQRRSTVISTWNDRDPFGQLFCEKTWRCTVNFELYKKNASWRMQTKRNPRRIHCFIFALSEREVERKFAKFFARIHCMRSFDGGNTVWDTNRWWTRAGNILLPTSTFRTRKQKKKAAEFLEHVKIHGGLSEKDISTVWWCKSITSIWFFAFSIRATLCLKKRTWFAT
jgi:hypothetical protein